MSYSQFRVDGNGQNNALHRTLTVGTDAGSALSRVIVGFNRSAPGGAAIDFNNGDGQTFGTRFSRAANGIGGLTHQGGQPLQLITQQAADIEFRTNGANVPRMVITSTGTVNIQGNATVNGGVAVTSDKRLKKDINDLDLGLETVLQMNPVTYSYTGDFGTSTTRPFVGLVAQELQKIAPDFVSNNTVTARNDEGEVIAEETFLQIHDSELKYVLVNAIKDQQEMIQAQAERISELENKINTLGDASSTNQTNVTLSTYDLAELQQNRPNPFNDSTVIDYVVPTNSQNASINIIGLNGQTIKSIDVDHVGQGSLNVNTADLPSGVYTYQLVVDGKLISTEKMTKTK